ncbi:hypothetical protein LINGRAHAP2_LOCUS31642 [Linum grandiflorum]
MEVKHLLQLNWVVQITHTYREGNRVADLLAHHGHSLSLGRTLFFRFPLRLLIVFSQT